MQLLYLPTYHMACSFGWSSPSMVWFMFGCFSSILMRQKPEDVTAIAIETGVQNTGIAIMLLKVSFPEAEADVSSLLPIIVACFTPGPLLLGYAVHYVMKRFKKSSHKNQGRMIFYCLFPSICNVVFHRFC
uniref:Sodium/bile acid cotransporter n=1 Tax=Ditylenchus dipsaci TaxID=166011 RepID=A0A915DF08_9BILA